MTTATFGQEERRLLDESLEGFFRDRYTFEHYRALSAPGESEGFDRAGWTRYASMGWLGIALPQSEGGTGGAMTELGVVMAAAGRRLALEPFVATLVLGAGAIDTAGTQGQRALLADVIEGRHLLALCHYERGAGYARDYVQSIALLENDTYVLTGEKSFTLHAHAADTLLVSAHLNDQNGPAVLLLVPRAAQGVQLCVAPALDGRKGGAVSFDNVRLDATACLGQAHTDRLDLIDALLDRAAIAVAAEAVGAMAMVTDKTVEYLKSREQFGQPLAGFQVLQHRLVDMSIACEESRALVHRALQALDACDEDARTTLWQAKVQTARSARFVGTQAVQLHGGMGMTDELAVGHYYKRLTMCETQFGDADWYLGRLADLDSASRSVGQP